HTSCYRDWSSDVCSSDLALARLAVLVQHRQRPVAGRGEEPEVAGGGRDHLCGELAGAVEQAHVGAGHRRVTGAHDAVDHGLLLEIGRASGRERRKTTVDE